MLPVMSTPISARDAADSSLILVPGWVPADWMSTLSPVCSFIRPAAICDLPPF